MSGRRVAFEERLRLRLIRFLAKSAACARARSLAREDPARNARETKSPRAAFYTHVYSHLDTHATHAGILLNGSHRRRTLACDIEHVLRWTRDQSPAFCTPPARARHNRGGALVLMIYNIRIYVLGCTYAITSHRAHAVA